jgi:hypothetical protein
MSQTTPQINKALVLEAFDTLPHTAAASALRSMGCTFQ